MKTIIQNSPYTYTACALFITVCLFFLFTASTTHVQVAGAEPPPDDFIDDSIPTQRCTSESVSWTVSDRSCTGTLSSTDVRSDDTAVDNIGPNVGSATYTCSESVTWEPKSGATKTCNRGNPPSPPWKVSAYIWNSRVNLWARTSCDMPIGGIGAGSCVWGCRGNSVQQACDIPNPPSCASSSCDGTTDAKTSLKYYHDGRDSNNDGVFGVGEIKPGEMRGSAWSPLLGAISFDLDDFPTDDCHGLTGSSRQARVVRVNLGSNGLIDDGDTIFNPTTDNINNTKIALIGCAYSSYLKDFILLSPVGASSVPNNWVGVTLDVNTGVVQRNAKVQGKHQYTSGVVNNTPNIEIFGCAWSSKNGRWAFGPNKNTVTATNANDCLPSHHNTDLKKRIDAVAINIPGQHSPSIHTNPRTARIGQRVTYTLECPPGYSRALALQLFEGSDAIDLVSRDNQNPLDDNEWNDPANEKRSELEPWAVRYDNGRLRHEYTETLFSPLSAIRLICVDKHTHKIFSGKGSGESGILGRITKSVRGVSVESVAVHSFSVNPQVIKEGGVVDIDVSVSNFGDAAKNNAFCEVTDTVTNKRVLCFKTESLSTVNTIDDLPNRSTPMYSADVITQDTRYELTCRFKKGPYTSADREYSESQLCGGGVTTTSWSKVGPLKTTVKVSPSRLVNRIVSSNTPTPLISTNGNNFVIGVNPSYINKSDIRIYEFSANEFSGGGNREINTARPNRIYTFFSNKSEADKATKNRCASQNGSAHLTCITNDLYGNYSGATIKVSMDGSTSVSVPKSNFAGRVFVTEMFTKDGRRSVKTIHESGSIGRVPQNVSPPPAPSSGELWTRCRCTADTTDSATAGVQTNNVGNTRSCVASGCVVRTCQCTVSGSDGATDGVWSDNSGACIASSCPIDGGWSTLPDAGTIACGERRVATCTNPSPQNNGRPCSSPAPTITGTDNCPCSAWTPWTPGTGNTCSDVNVTQTRTCTAPANRVGETGTRTTLGTKTCYGDCGSSPHTCRAGTYEAIDGRPNLWYCRGSRSNTDTDDEFCSS